MAASPERITEWRAQFEKMGAATVRTMLGQYPHDLSRVAVEWLAEKDAEAHSRSEAARAEEREIARSARDAALAANELAREANEIARAASVSADRSADAARTNNKIAIAALIAAIAAIAVSIASILKHAS